MEVLGGAWCRSLQFGMSLTRAEGQDDVSSNRLPQLKCAGDAARPGVNVNQ